MLTLAALCEGARTGRLPPWRWAAERQRQRSAGAPAGRLQMWTLSCQDAQSTLALAANGSATEAAFCRIWWLGAKVDPVKVPMEVRQGLPFPWLCNTSRDMEGRLLRPVPPSRACLMYTSTPRMEAMTLKVDCRSWHVLQQQRASSCPAHSDLSKCF